MATPETNYFRKILQYLIEGLQYVSVKQLVLKNSSLLPGQGEPLYAIADLHGDYSKALRALRLATLVDEDGYWAGKKAEVVQLGDLMDRGPYSLDCINLFERLKVSLLW